MRTEPHRLVFIDETGTQHEDDPRARTLQVQGLSAFALKAPLGHWKTQTFVAGLRWRLPDRAVGHRRADRPGDLRDRRAHPTRPHAARGRHRHPGQSAAHKSPAAEQAIRERGAWLLFLPPYSPDLNPIEMAFAKLKAHLRAMAMRTIPTLTLEGHRANLPSLHPRGVCKLLPSRRIRIQMSARCSRNLTINSFGISPTSSPPTISPVDPRP